MTNELTTCGCDGFTERVICHTCAQTIDYASDTVMGLLTDRGLPEDGCPYCGADNATAGPCRAQEA